MPLDGAVLTDEERRLFLEEGRMNRQMQTDHRVATRHCPQTVPIGAGYITTPAMPYERFLFVRDMRCCITQVLRLLLHHQGVCGVTTESGGEMYIMRAVSPEALSVVVNRITFAELLYLALVEFRTDIQVQTVHGVIAVCMRQ